MNGQISTQELAVQAMVYAMAVSIMSVAMGIVIAAMGPELLKLPPEERKGTKKAISDLRLAFGTSIVDKAIKNVGYDDILVLCKEIERLYIEDMKGKYGGYAVKVALEAAPPGDIKTAHEIAAAMARRGYGKFIPPREVPAPAHVEEAAKEEGKRRSRRAAKPVKDTKTGVVYKSKASAGMSVASEYGLDPTNHFVWYEVIKRDPERFVEVSTEEYQKYMAAQVP